ncbi:MAG: GNAT family N-acetyltransferase [Methylococcales bacterium]|nr:GNAT family N-acetyltransferase [Methylococcales bacterium]
MVLASTIQKIGSLSNHELVRVKELMLTVWPKAAFYTFEYLDWLYRLNPAGTAETFNVWAGDSIIAHYAAIPIVANLFGHEERGLLSLNTVVHPDFQGKGYFKSLALSTYEEAKLRNASFVFGIGNAQSTLLGQRLLKFQKVSPLTVKLGLGNVRRKTEPSALPCFQVKWDEKSLAWRLNRPDAEYRVTSNSSGTWLWRNTGTYGIYAEMGWFSTEAKQLKSAFSQVGTMPTITPNPVKLWIGLDQRCEWAGYRYYDLPERFKPSPLNLVFKDLTNLNRVLVPETTRISLLDFDAY